MSKSDLKDLLRIDLTVRGKKSGQDISRPVWFVHEDDKFFTSCTGFGYKLVQKCAKRSNHENFGTRTRVKRKSRNNNDGNKVKEIVEKFRSKYGNFDVQKYYTKFDVCIEFALK